jgi:RNA polymerase sigma-70 factor (ECF subfamily)
MRDTQDHHDSAASARWLAYGASAYRMVAHLLGSDAAVDDIIQQAYIEVMQAPRKPVPPDDERAWFLRVVTHNALDHLRSEARRKKREAAAATMLSDTDPAQRPDPELVAELRQALRQLDEKYRLVLALCIQEGLTHREAALVLDISERTVFARIQEGLERLRGMLGGREKKLDPALMLSGLAAAAPEVPAAFTASFKTIVAQSAATTTNATLGGLLVKISLGLAAAALLTAGVLNTPWGAGAEKPGAQDGKNGATAGQPAPNNPVTAQTAREEIFEFTEKPAIVKQGEKYVISFASKANCDATVAVVDKDDKVVRHLASGVLGKNAPAPFKQDSLAQKIDWDGMDDAGKRAPAGCNVRVGLGLKATYDKSFADYFTFNTSSGIGMAVDKDGSLFVIQDGLVRSFSREGAYAKTLMPPQAGITPETFGGRPMVETTSGDFAVVGEWLRGPFPNFSAKGKLIGSTVVGPDARLAALWNGNNPEVLTQLHLFGKDGSLPKGSSMILGDHRMGYFTGPYTANKVYMGGGINHLALSPDGEWLYISGAGDAVLRYKWADLKGPRLPLQIFKGSAAKSGSDNESFQMVAGVACDAQGSVYIADNANHRIQVYKPDGAYERTIKADAPHNLAVHPKTGDIYVLSWRSGDLPPNKNTLAMPKLLKLSKDGAVLASLEIKTNLFFWHFPYTGMALDAAAATPALWLMDKDGVFKVEDKGNAFVEVLRLGKDVDKSIYAGAPLYNLGRMAVDPVREEVYIGSGSIFQANTWTRMDGRTGKIDPAFKKKMMEMAVGLDGLLYARVGAYGTYVVRFTREGQMVPFANGLDVAALGTKAIYIGVKGWSNVWQSGLDVTPAGDVIIMAHEFGKDVLTALFPKDGPPTPVKDMNMAALAASGAPKIAYPEALKKRFPREGAYSLVQIWDKDGGEKCFTAFESPTRGAGVHGDAQGNLYMVNKFTIPGKPELESLKPGQKTYCPAGSLMKVGWKGGSWPLARAVHKGQDPAMPGIKMEYNDGNNFVIGGIDWAVQDVSDTFGEQACGCGNTRFDLDGFARSWLPANHIQSVLVYDANGNKILRVGRYGNADCRGKDSLAPNPDIGFCWVYAIAASDEALYVLDGGNRRTLRAKLGFHAEASVPAP